MASVAAKKGQKLYVLKNKNTGIIWLASISTNTFGPWDHAKEVEPGVTKETLKADGWRLCPATLALEEWPIAGQKEGEGEGRGR